MSASAQLQSSCINSPSGHHQLTIEMCNTQPDIYTTRGIIQKGKDTIATIDRSYHIFHHSFFNKNNNEWLVSGKNCSSQTFVNCETREVFDSSVASVAPTAATAGATEGTEEEKFCWGQVKASPDGNTLAVYGCYWGSPYEILFYDFTDPKKGWPILKLSLPEKVDLGYNQLDQWEWTNDGFRYTAHGQENQKNYSVCLKRQNNEMVCTEVDQSPEYLQQLAEQAKIRLYQAQFVSQNKLYLQLMNRLNHLNPQVRLKKPFDDPANGHFSFDLGHCLVECRDKITIKSKQPEQTFPVNEVDQLISALGKLSV